MANWSTLKAAIASVIKNNGNQEITGQVLQNTLNSIISNIGKDSSFVDIAIPSTNPGVPDGNVFYLATKQGIYSNFSGITVLKGEVAILEWRGKWEKKETGLATNEKVLELENSKQDNLTFDKTPTINSNNPVTSGGIREALDVQKNEVNEAKDKALQAIHENEQSAISNFNSQRVTPEMLSESTKQLIEASGGGTITNLADDEDIQSVNDGTGSNVLKLANRIYNPVNFSGKGYKIIRKNIVEGKNVLTQDMVNEPNTVYEIRYDFDLNEQEITIPEGCILKFEGGNFRNGSITGSETCIVSPAYNIFYNTIIKGSYNNDYAFCEWFGAVGDGITDDTISVQKTIDSFNCVNFCAKTYLLEQVTMHDYTNIRGVYHKTIIVTSSTEKFNIDNLPLFTDVKTIFYAYDKAFITLSCLDFQLTNADYCNAIVFDNSDTNGAGITFDLRPTVTDITVNGGYYAIYVDKLTREARITNFVAYYTHADYGMYIRGTDNTLLNCTTGGTYLGGIYARQNCRLNNIKCFAAHKYFQSTKDLTVFSPDKYYAMYLEGSYINAVNIDLQQNCLNGLYVGGISNYVQGVFNAAAGYTRPKDSTTVCCNIVVGSGARGNIIDSIHTTDFLNSYCSHFIYMLSHSNTQNNEFNISSHQTGVDTNTVVCNVYTDANVINYNGRRLNPSSIPHDYIIKNSVTTFDIFSNYFCKTLSYNNSATLDIPLTGILTRYSQLSFNFNAYSSINWGSNGEFLKVGYITACLFINNVQKYEIGMNVKCGSNVYTRLWRLDTMQNMTEEILPTDKVILRLVYLHLAEEATNVQLSIPDIRILSSRTTPYRIPVTEIIPTNDKFDIYKNNKLHAKLNGADLEIKDTYALILNYNQETASDFRWIKLFSYNHNEAGGIECFYNSDNAFMIHKTTIYKLYGSIIPDIRYFREGNITTIYAKLKSPYDKFKVLDSVYKGTWYGIQYDKNVEYTDIPDMINSQEFEVMSESGTPTICNLIFYENNKLLVGKANGVHIIPTYHHSVLTSGAFSTKPASSRIPIGFAYFCTDKKTTEGSTNGIMIYHKGDGVWVDALGRVIK